LIASGIEAAWRLSDWGALEQFASNSSLKDTFESSLGLLFNMLRKRELLSFESSWRRFLEKDHEPSSFGTYEREYDFYVKLHIKRDIGKFWEIIQAKEAIHDEDLVKSLVNSWEARIEITKPNIRTRELILNVHTTLIDIAMYFYAIN
jgi:hypothetical protein